MADRIPFVVESVYQVEGLSNGTPIYITKFVPAELPTPCITTSLTPTSCNNTTMALKMYYPGSIPTGRCATPVLFNGGGNHKFPQITNITNAAAPLQTPTMNTATFFPATMQQVSSSTATSLTDVNAEFLTQIVNFVSAVPRVPRIMQQLRVAPAPISVDSVSSPAPPQSPSITSSVSFPASVQQIQVATPSSNTGTEKSTIVINMTPNSHAQYTNCIPSFATNFQQARSHAPLLSNSSGTGCFPVMEMFPNNPTIPATSLSLNIQQSRSSTPPPTCKDGTERTSLIGNISFPLANSSILPTSPYPAVLQQVSPIAMQPVMYPAFATTVQQTNEMMATTAPGHNITEVLELSSPVMVDASQQEDIDDTERKGQESHESYSTLDIASNIDQESCCEEQDSELTEELLDDQSDGIVENMNCETSVSSDSGLSVHNSESYTEVISANDNESVADCDFSANEMDGESKIVDDKLNNQIKGGTDCHKNDEMLYEDSHTDLEKTEQPTTNSDVKAIQAYLDKQGICPYQCEDCGKLYSQLSDLERHMWKHTGERLSAYSESKMSYDSSLAPVGKMSKLTDKCYRCKWCGAAFRRIVSLRKHVGSHSKHLHTCEQCGKTFATKEDLSNHIKNHSGAKSLFCGECGRVFMERGKLKSHIREHRKQWLGILTRLALSTSRAK